MPKILFRADAEKSIGTGDLMSLIYLSREFSKNSWESYFVVRDYREALNLIKGRKLENLYMLKSDDSLESEIDFIKRLCVREDLDCIFLEVTKNSLLEYRGLGDLRAIKACINFDGVISDDFDIVVNWCIDSTNILYNRHLRNNRKFILGFENVILPADLDWDRIENRTYNKGIEKILIAIGGVDEFNLTEKILLALAQKQHDYKVRVIAGPGYNGSKDFFDSVSARFKEFVFKENVESLFEDYLWADIAFSAGGLISSELVATHTPAILIATHRHQEKRCEYFANKGWAYYAGVYSNFNQEEISEALSYTEANICLFQEELSQLKFRGGNEKIFKSVHSYRQSKELV